MPRPSTSRALFILGYQSSSYWKVEVAQRFSILTPSSYFSLFSSAVSEEKNSVMKVL